jgi:hypothetical protein
MGNARFTNKIAVVLAGIFEQVRNEGGKKKSPLFYII